MKKISLIIAFFVAMILNSDVFANSRQFNNYIQSAYKAMNSGKYQLAIQNYNNALRFYPNEADIHNNLGVAYSKINDLKNAELHYKKTVQLDPSNAFAYSNLGNLYEREEKYAEAAKYLEKYTQLTHPNKDIYYRLGDLYSKTGNKELCLKNYEKFVQLNDNNFDTYCLMGNNCESFGDFRKAAHYFQKALSVSDNQPEKGNLAYALQELRICEFKNNINTINPPAKAPQEVYNLVKSDNVLKYRDTFDKLYEILDFVWADENGRILLTKAIENKIPINITFGKKQTHVLSSDSYNKPLSALRCVPLPIPMALSVALLSEATKGKEIVVNLGEDIIHDYKSPDSSIENNMYALMAVVHELGHASAKTINVKKSDSIEEEMIVSMMGYNFASKVLIGRPLTRNESIRYAKNSYKALMSDEHKSLPLYNDFKNIISKLGINLYNYDTYADLYQFQRGTSD